MAAAAAAEAPGNNGGALQKSYFDVLGICCSSEIPLIENILKEIEGIKEIKVIVATRTLIVLHHNLLVSQAQIVKALNQARLEANVRAYGDQQKNHRKKWPSPYAVASGLLLLLSFLKYVNPVFKWVALAAVAAGIWPIALKSFTAVRHLRIDINILALIAVIGTIVLNDYLEAATIVFLFTIAEWLESRAGHKANAVMSSLLSIAPQKAVLADTGEVVGADEVKMGTLLAVKAGEDIPIDGIVVEGKCEVDEKTLTGESFPVAKQKDSTVWAGTINLNGYVTVKTTALAEDCVVAKMAKLVEEAQNSKSRTQRFIDKCAKFYTPAVIIISTGIAVIPFALRLHNRSHWFHLALVVLVSACPCALILSTPVASFCALTKAATSGLLIKGGDCLETLGKIKIMAFDKTGTITRGEFMVTEFQALDKENISLDTLLYWVSSIESKSSHPMAAALVDHGRSLSINPKPENVDDFQNFPGEGVHGRIDGKDIYIGNRKIATRANCATVPEIKDEAKDGRTLGYVFCGTTAAGIFTLSDSCRTGAKEAMAEIRSLGIKTTMLTGDSSAAALQAQKELGKALETVHAELLPEDKTRLINDFKREGPTAMIGDGLNDAPALATADIGISMGISGSALAIETGDVILMTNDIRKIPKAIRLARRANRKVIENVILSVAPRTAILGLAFGGHPLVWAAVLADVGACVLVILNSMLLLRGTEGHKGKKAGMFSASHCSSKHKCCHVGSHSEEHGGHTHDHGCSNESSHSSSHHQHHHHHHHHHEHEDCGSLKKTHNGCSTQKCASTCDSGMKKSSSCKKSKLVDSCSRADDPAGSVKPFEHEHCVHNNQPNEHEHCVHNNHPDEHEQCVHNNHPDEHEHCVHNNQPDEHEHCVHNNHPDEHGHCIHNNQPDEHEHHTHFSCDDHHVEDEHCSLKNTLEFCSFPRCASNSCEKIQCTSSPANLDGSAGSDELHERGCCTHNTQSAQHDHEIQTLKCDLDDSHSSSPDHHNGNGCCSQKNAQKVSLSHSMCHSETCNSSPCGKTKCVDSTEKQHTPKGSLELLQDHNHCHQGSCDTSNFVSESQENHRKNCSGPCKSRPISRCTEDECTERAEMIVDCAEGNEHHKMKQHHCHTHLSLENEGVHPHCKASKGDNDGAINKTTKIELEAADHSNPKHGNTCKALENRETNNNCKTCRRGSSQLKIGETCVGLKKNREIRGCCKSYMRECCRKHGDIRMAVRGGLNEIIIE
ncbi:cadmium/zinc-transporting ATPase HMA3-like isoform X1 [Cucurbita maxima]|uniref:Cadmium/zinc-transporting ATPase HMA3-like isoform X1 n=1 Tax=Cucurbita maxima TaxID=3661 RepID=A0A6J1JIQ2_CUCMA|nr:cadmium/zinc-transporting ATPase HMA3-like isoform X1 [Cucurbita maxima]XP_022987178.1 cadmium/zinc-transporting ATPase HMA3-like isoform X1 [Cucurbita maxima]